MADAVQLRFHRSIYPPDAVRRAVARFAPLARAVVEEHPADTLVVLTDIVERARPRIADELGNHALFEAIAQRRGG